MAVPLSYLVIMLAGITWPAATEYVCNSLSITAAPLNDTQYSLIHNHRSNKPAPRLASSAFNTRPTSLSVIEVADRKIFLARRGWEIGTRISQHTF